MNSIASDVDDMPFHIEMFKNIFEQAKSVFAIGKKSSPNETLLKLGVKDSLVSIFAHKFEDVGIVRVERNEAHGHSENAADHDLKLAGRSAVELPNEVHQQT